MNIPFSTADILLYSMSSRRSPQFSVETVRRQCRELEQSRHSAAWIAFLLLVRQGHVEWLANDRCMVCPPTLRWREEENGGRATFYGVRTPLFLHMLAENHGFHPDVNPGGDLHATPWVLGTTRENAERIAQRYGLGFESKRLTNFFRAMPCFHDVLRRLAGERLSSALLDNAKRLAFEKRRGFGTWDSGKCVPGLYRKEIGNNFYKYFVIPEDGHGVVQLPDTCHAAMAAWREYGKQRSSGLTYDERRAVLTIPRFIADFHVSRPPVILERLLTFSSRNGLEQGTTSWMTRHIGKDDVAEFTRISGLTLETTHGHADSQG